jgi:hypothetical protein
MDLASLLEAEKWSFSGGQAPVERRFKEPALSLKSGETNIDAPCYCTMKSSIAKQINQINQIHHIILGILCSCVQRAHHRVR